LLCETLQSLLEQSALPSEIIVIDASDEPILEKAFESLHVQASSLGVSLKWPTATQRGAAPQRNQGHALTTLPFIHFMDDDVLLEKDCLKELWKAMDSNAGAGGVSAMIVNEKYQPPGPFSRWLFSWLNGGELPTYAGRCLGCGVTTLPSDDPSLPEAVPVDWLVTGCVLYRRQALPDPPFPALFNGASLAEDLALSLTVGRKWKLFNARQARLQHRAPGGDHKRNLAALSEMEVLNRHHIMTRILERNQWSDHFQFWFVNLLMLPSMLIQPGGWRRFPSYLLGRLRAAAKLAG